MRVFSIYGRYFGGLEGDVDCVLRYWGAGLAARGAAHSSFEGVCVTTVILAPGACGLGLRAALLATTSPDTV